MEQAHKKPTFYITTPIYYPSAQLHIGHTYCTTLADVLARYHRLKGEDVFFLTGSDEHGQKIQRKAEEAGVTPQAYVDHIVAGFQKLWKKLNITNDDFVRTTEKRHAEVVQALFQKAYDKGDIYKSQYEGWYCTPDETFWPENKLGPDHTCPDCGRPVELVKEESYFFRMSNYADRWLQFIEENPDFIQPASRRHEMIEFVKSGLEDLSVSRSSFDWGIPVPFDDKHVVYVWFDALANYLTGIGYLDAPEKFEQYWPADLHLVGKEIVRFHAIIWPIMLMSLGLPLPKKVYGHGWLIVDGVKMSKSIGNVVDPMPLLDEFGADAIRYFLTTDISLGQDGNFSRERLIKKTNSDLANDLGNLLHRTLTMVEKYRDGVVTATDAPLGVVVADANAALTKLAQETVASYTRDMDKLAMNDAFKAVWVYVRALNKYIDTTEPWKLSKGTAPADLDSVLYHLVDGLRTVAILVAPLIPQAAENMWAQLGLTDFAAARLDGAAPETYPSGTTVHKTQPLFPRHELDTVTEEKKLTEETKPTQAAAAKAQPETAAKESKQTAADEKPQITIDDFAKLDLRVAEVLACEKVEKADKLLHLTVTLGDEERSIVSGIAQHYQPEELVGKHVIVVTNLKPVKLRGVLSQGMILAGSQDGALHVPFLPDLPAGSRVK